MLTITRTYLLTRYNVSSFDEFESIAKIIYEIGNDETKSLKDFEKAGVQVKINEGSLEIITIIGVTAGALFSAISAYGSFWSGVDTLKKHARRKGNSVLDRIRKSPKLEKQEITTTRITNGTLTSLNRLHNLVINKEITAENGVIKVIRLLEKEGEFLNKSDKLRIMESFGVKEKVGLNQLLNEERVQDKYMISDNISSGQYSLLGVAESKASYKVTKKHYIEITREPEQDRPTIKGE